ncbi:ABC transporter ATP-binding protein [Thioclava sp. FR2]|uniref:ABC transporter ATP-binding protein n=1 Tax=Thioclava sp. FR2 TaxID=3445780 RepID=UPI003EBB0F6C
MGKITLKSVRKSFGETHVIPGIDLEINDGEFVVFVGPSGCGKSTLLRLIAGLEDTSGGTIEIDGTDATSLPPAKRGLAMVFQSYALYPHMSVRKNIAFPLKMAGLDPAEQEKRVQHAAKILNLSNYLDRRPGQLSGGQRQRVAIGRAIVREPSAFLFDEPLSNLDAALRVSMRQEISELHQSLKTTMIYVTHDQVEAMTMADKIVVLHAGVIEQVGSPLDLYHSPDNLFVAGFIGSPKMNFITGAEAAKHNCETLGVRPEHIDITPNGIWEGRVGLSEHLGSDTFLKVEAGALGTLTVRANGEVNLHHGDIVRLSPQDGKIHRFDKDGKAIR